MKYDGKFASRWRTKSPDVLCAVLPQIDTACRQFTSVGQAAGHVVKWFQLSRTLGALVKNRPEYFMQNLCGCPDILIFRESAIGQIPSSRTTIHSFIIRFLQENVNGIFGKFAFLPILQKAFDGISVNLAPFLCDVAIGQYCTKSVWRLCTPSACKFPIIFHKNAREYIKYSLRFLFHLTKNLTTHLSHNLCAVLP